MAVIVSPIIIIGSIILIGIVSQWNFEEYYFKTLNFSEILFIFSVGLSISLSLEVFILVIILYYFSEIILLHYTNCEPMEHWQRNQILFPWQILPIHQIFPVQHNDLIPNGN